MVETASDPLAGFQFSTIGHASSSLLSRISDIGPEHAVSPSPSPLSSPKMPASGFASNSKLIASLAPDLPLSSISQESSPATGQVRPLPMANGLPPRPLTAVAGPSSVPEQRRTPTTAAATQGASRTSASASVKPSSSAVPQRPPLVPIATRNLSAASSPCAPNVLGLGMTSPASMNSTLSTGDERIESFRQQLRRLHVEEDEYRRKAEEAQQATARLQDQAARWHARADTVVESMSSYVAAVEERLVVSEQHVAQLEEEAKQRAEELREARATIARLEETNAAQRKEVEEVRTQAAEQQREDKVRVAEAIAKAEDALKRVADQQHERELGDALIRKKAQEDRVRWETQERELRAFWEARERNLLAQLEDQKRLADARIETLDQQVQELQSALDIEKLRRMEELHEEKMKLERREAQLMAQMPQQNQESRVSRTTPTSVVSFPSPTSASPQVPSQPHAASAVSTSASAPTRRTKELHISTTSVAPQGSVANPLPGHASLTPSTRERKPSVGFPDPTEPLLAVKVEDEKVAVKPEVTSPLPDRFSQSLRPRADHHSIPDAQVPRREQSLEYTPSRELPVSAAISNGAEAASESVPGATASRAEAQPAPHTPSPDISLGADSPNNPVPLFLPSLDSSLEDLQNVPQNTAQSIPGRDSALSSARSVGPVRIRRPSPQNVQRNQQPTEMLPRPPSPPVIHRDERPRSRSRSRDRFQPWRSPDSPPPRNQGGGVQWSSGRDRHKRGRDEERPMDAPNPRRPRMDSYRPGPQSSSRDILRRGRTPPRPPSPRYEPRTQGQAYYNAPQSSYQPPPPPHHAPPYQEPPVRRDRARTPPGFPDDHMPHQYAPPPPPTAMSDTEARSYPQVDFVPHPPSHASGAHAWPRVAAATAAQNYSAEGSREAPVGTPQQPADGLEKISLLARMGHADGDVTGRDGERSENDRRSGYRGQQTQPSDGKMTLLDRMKQQEGTGAGHPGSRGSGTRGGRARGRGRGSTRGSGHHPGHGAHQDGASRPLEERLSISTSKSRNLKDRLTEASAQ